MEITVLGSGSAGNASVITSGSTSVLVDAGLSCKQLQMRLEATGIDPDSLDGILITHEHGDHCRGLDVFCRKREVPVYCNPMTREMLLDSVKTAEIQWRLINTGDAFELGDLLVQTFSVPHDAVDPMGYRFQDEHSVLGIVSDIGFVTDTVRSQVQQVDTLFIEANYDEQLLMEDTKRPFATKQRISSRHGHLSNEQTADLVAKAAANPGLQRVILGHLSQDCNSPEHAIKTIREFLDRMGRSDIDLVCASQEAPTPSFPVKASAPLPPPAAMSSEAPACAHAGPFAEEEEVEAEPLVAVATDSEAAPVEASVKPHTEKSSAPSEYRRKPAKKRADSSQPQIQGEFAF